MTLVLLSLFKVCPELYEMGLSRILREIPFGAYGRIQRNLGPSAVICSYCEIVSH